MDTKPVNDTPAIPVSNSPELPPQVIPNTTKNKEDKITMLELKKMKEK